MPEKTGKPEEFDFFVLGWDLQHAVAICERWDTLTEAARALARRKWVSLTIPDLVAMGFDDDRPPGAPPLMEFHRRGFKRDHALKIQDKWPTLTTADLVALGFVTQPTDSRGKSGTGTRH
jgi:hypothetical protein